MPLVGSSTVPSSPLKEYVGEDKSRLILSGWTYRRADTVGVVELGTVRGRDVALPAHFHDEDQITFVMAGRRTFLLHGRSLTIKAGGCALIPANTVHQSLVEPAGVDCLNLYVPAGEYASTAMVSEVERIWRKTFWLAPTELMDLVQRHRLRWKDNAASKAFPFCPVAELAARRGVSREGFSRAFTREHGMPPHAFGLITRLNHARRLLRSGAPLVNAALEAGFADQSHLGRCFRRTFGVTPGQFREGQRSQTFQTAAASNA